MRQCCVVEPAACTRAAAAVAHAPRYSTSPPRWLVPDPCPSPAARPDSPPLSGCRSWTVPGWTASQGATMEMYSCANNAGQKFTYNPQTQAIASGQNPALCFTVYGTLLQLQPCDANNAAQAFQAQCPTPPASVPALVQDSWTMLGCFSDNGARVIPNWVPVSGTYEPTPQA